MNTLVLTYSVWLVAIVFLLSVVALYYWIRRNPRDAATAMGTSLEVVGRDPIEDRCAETMEALTRALPVDIDASARSVIQVVGNAVIEEALVLTHRIAPMIQHASPCRHGESGAEKAKRCEREFLDDKVVTLYRRSALMLVAKARATLDAIEAQIASETAPELETQTLTEGKKP
jgi:hypothetical protein